MLGTARHATARQGLDDQLQNGTVTPQRHYAYTTSYYAIAHTYTATRENTRLNLM